MFKTLMKRSALRVNHTILRSVYIPSRRADTRSRRTASHTQRLVSEVKELDLQLKELQEEEKNLHKMIKARQEEKNKKKSAVEYGSNPQAAPSEEEVALLDAAVQKPTYKELKPPRGLEILPPSVRKRIDTKAVSCSGLFARNDKWAGYLASLTRNGGLEKLPLTDIEAFVVKIPLKERARFIEPLESLIEDSGVMPSQFLRDTLMAAYAERKDPMNVERLLKLCPSPTIHSFGHLAKAYFQVRDFENVAKILSRTSAHNLTPSLPIYTVVLQSLVQHKKYNDAFLIFDNLKYMSIDTQPDVRVYNSMILAAAKTYNVNKALDLHTEMTTRPINPLRPDKQTLNSLIYACARDKDTHMRAWAFFLELRENGLQLDFTSMRSLFYLCGTTGELQMARALFRQMSLRPETMPDSFMFNCLLRAYVNHVPGSESVILNSSIGSRIRAQLLFDHATISTKLPPLLPIVDLNKRLIVAETTALVEFYQENDITLLTVNSQSSTHAGATPALHTFLEVIKEHGTCREFEEVLQKYTKQLFRPPRDASIDQDETHLVERDEADRCQIQLDRGLDQYLLALKAAIKFKDLDFGRKLWEERGAFRRSEVFRNLPKSLRDQSDARFARELVRLLAICGEVESAVDLVESTTRLLRWNRQHLEPLVEACAAIEDNVSLKRIQRILYRYYKNQRQEIKAARI